MDFQYQYGFLLALLVMVFLVGPTSYIVQLSLESFESMWITSLQEV